MFPSISRSSSEANSRVGVAMHDRRRDDRRVWQNGRVPFVISETVMSQIRSLVNESIAHLHQQLKLAGFPGLVQWTPRTDEADYVVFIMTPANKTYSLVGKRGEGGEQQISLSDWVRVSHILHEMCHAMGLVHEHSRFDRDEAGVEVVATQGDPDFAVGGIPLGPYDKTSIMHYAAGRYANGCEIGPQGAVFGGSELSQHDITALRAIYGPRCCTSELWENTPFAQPAVACMTCLKFFCTICADSAAFQREHHEHLLDPHHLVKILCKHTVPPQPAAPRARSDNLAFYVTILAAAIIVTCAVKRSFIL